MNFKQFKNALKEHHKFNIEYGYYKMLAFFTIVWIVIGYVVATNY